MYAFFIRHFDKISLFLKEPIFYILIIFAFLLGMKFFHAMHNSEIRELKLKAERLDVIEKEYMEKFHEIDEMQYQLLKAIYNYQIRHPNNKVIVTKEGYIFDDLKKKLMSDNLIRQILSKEPDKASMQDFESLISSIPSRFMRLIPENRLSSPYVIVITNQGVEKLKKTKK